MMFPRTEYYDYYYCVVVVVVFVVVIGVVVVVVVAAVVVVVILVIIVIAFVTVWALLLLFHFGICPFCLFVCSIVCFALSQFSAHLRLSFV